LASAISRPAIQLDLGITTYVNGIATSQAQIDTSMVAIDTIDYVVIVQSGVTSTSARTEIEPAPCAHLFAKRRTRVRRTPQYQAHPLHNKAANGTRSSENL
jgi:hypothetical protein